MTAKFTTFLSTEQVRLAVTPPAAARYVLRYPVGAANSDVLVKLLAYTREGAANKYYHSRVRAAGIPQYSSLEHKQDPGKGPAIIDTWPPVFRRPAMGREMSCYKRPKATHPRGIEQAS